MRKIENHSDEFTLITLKRGLRNGDSDTLKYNSYRKNNKTFNKLLIFAEGYMRGEENIELVRRSLRCPSPRAKRGYNSSRRDKRSRNSHNDGHSENRRRGRFNDDVVYRSHFISYAQFDQPTQDLLKLISHKYELLRMMDICMFEIRDENSYCQHHCSKRHSTDDYMQLQDILEKIARQGDLT
jgi:hypothetical protein